MINSLINFFKALLKALSVIIFHPKRCENCQKWKTQECSEHYYSEIGPLWKCSEWLKKSH